jgi:uncharacterized membrane protein YeaQ/YmgE (transglycosylase-associated protein family)
MREAMDLDTVFGWTAIGAAAALAGMIWPFRRGVKGVFINLVTGIIGALLAAFLSFLVLPPNTVRGGPARLFIAALGALSALGLVHAVHTAWAHRMLRRAASR